MTANAVPPGDPNATGAWIADPAHRDWLRQDALRQLDFFRPSLREDGGFDVLEVDGRPLANCPQELHTTTRMVHSFALAKALGVEDSDAIIESGLEFLWTRHRDPEQGGYAWAVQDGRFTEDAKLAYGHVFVLLAGSSAKMVGFPQADRLIADIAEVIERRFWDEDAGLLRDEFTRDWRPFSSYRGYNSNMHGVEAFLAAYEATGDEPYLDKAGRILDFFTQRIAPQYAWRIPEHYDADWGVDLDYQGDPVFRPRGTTPGHSFELSRLLLQHWDLAGRSGAEAPERARKMIEAALSDAWVPSGGLVYTLDYSAGVQMANRFWWPLTEAIGAVATLIKLEGSQDDETWYRRLWQAASTLFIDHERGGWFPEVDADGRPSHGQFSGKPDIYHALQADLIPLAPGLSHLMRDLKDLRAG